MKIKFSGTITELKHFIDNEVINPIISQLTSRITHMSEILQAKINELQAQLTILANKNQDLSDKVNAQTVQITALTGAVDNAKVVEDHVVTLTGQTIDLLKQVKEALDQAGADSGSMTALQDAIDGVTQINAAILGVSAKVDANTASVDAAAGVAGQIAAEGSAVSQSESDALAENAL